jgi:formate dehydrogenase iron-sulfur subunit
MSVKVYVPRDSAALSVGAEGVARAIASEASSRGLDITLVRNGSRGLFWLEPVVEVETSGQRIAYGPVSREAVAGLFDAGFTLGNQEGKSHALCLGPTEEIDESLVPQENEGSLSPSGYG